MIRILILDTREQLPLWEEIPGKNVQMTLHEGDYTTADLLGVAHAERKSGNDLYGSIIQGHKRFRNEILRAKEKNLLLVVFVECTEYEFFSKRFKGGYRLKTPTSKLRKIISTIKEKYDLRFVFCDGRENMRWEILNWFDEREKKLGVL